MQQYDGEVKRVKKKKKTGMPFDFKSLGIWYVGVIISFIPVFIDMLVYMADNGEITVSYWISACIHGDILWIISTIIVLSVIDHITDVKDKNNGLLIAGLVLWGLVSTIWGIFKYRFPSSYDRIFPLHLTIIILVISLIICTALQIKTLKVSK